MALPTRVGIIGLSYKGWARDGHFPYLKASPDYQIVAICNSSVKSSQEAIVTYNLPAKTKAYCDPQGMFISSFLFIHANLFLSNSM